MALSLRILVLCLLLVSTGLGCRLTEQHSAHRSPLASALPAPDSITLEVFLTRVPSGDKALTDDLWRQIDELRFPTDLRRELAQNGFRAGVVGSHMPIALAQLLKLSDKPPAKDEAVSVSIEEEPATTLNVRQLRAGHRTEIQPLRHVYDQLHVLMREGGQVRGRTYFKAEARLSLQAFPEPNGSFRLELMPEVQHGEQHQRWVGNEGIMRLDASRPKQIFEQLALKLNLVPGEMLVMSCLPERAGSLGHYFFSQAAATGQPVQKLLVVRVAQAGPDPSFREEPTKTLDLTIE